MHYFIWYFIKGEKNLFRFAYLWYSTPTLYVEKQLEKDIDYFWYHMLLMKNYFQLVLIFTIGIKITYKFNYNWYVLLISKFLVELFKMIYLLTIGI